MDLDYIMPFAGISENGHEIYGLDDCSELAHKLEDHRVGTFSEKEMAFNVLGLMHYHKWSLTICNGCFDTLKSSKMQS